MKKEGGWTQLTGGVPLSALHAAERLGGFAGRGVCDVAVGAEAVHPEIEQLACMWR